ncbi:MAG: hypothetical protein ACRELA_13770 [Candidatus Rokuibacteriota bacterium]
MKIRRVTANARRKAFEVTAAKKRLVFPFARLDVQPTSDDPIAKVFVDPERGADGFTYSLQAPSGTLHVSIV